MKQLFNILISAVAIGLVACAEQTTEPGVMSVEATEFEQIITERQAQVLDVRTEGEYAKGHLPNAINIDINKHEFNDTARNLLDKEVPVAIYCRSGRRSKIAADILADMGYKVIELNHGIIEWKGKVEY